jgi:hypothetical protein
MTPPFVVGALFLCPFLVYLVRAAAVNKGCLAVALFAASRVKRCSTNAQGVLRVIALQFAASATAAKRVFVSQQ